MITQVERECLGRRYTAFRVTFDHSFVVRTPTGRVVEDVVVTAEVTDRRAEVLDIKREETGEEIYWFDLPRGELERMEARALEVHDEERFG